MSTYFDFFQKVSYFRFIPPVLPSSIIIKYREKIALFISITLKSDYDTNQIKLTLDSIVNNLKNVHETFGINIENILTIIQIDEIYEPSSIKFLFSESVILDANDVEYFCSVLKYKYKSEGLEETQPLDVLLVYKKDNTRVKMHRTFLEGFCNELRKKPSLFTKVPFFALFTTTGVILNPDNLASMFKALTYSDAAEPHLCSNQTIGVHGTLAVNNLSFCDYFTNIQMFEYNKLYTYDLNFKNLSGYVELSGEFFMLKVNDVVMNIISKYFENNKDELSSEYVFYSQLSYVLQSNAEGNNKFSIRYLPDCQATYNIGGFTFTEWMDYNTEVQKAQFLISFDFLKSSCRNFPSNIINFYHILLAFINFVFPGLFMFVLYTVYIQALGPENIEADYILLVVYSFVIIFTGFLSLIGSPKYLCGYYIGLYIIYFLFYMLFFVCSITAVYNLRTQEESTGYRFGIEAFISLITINITLSFIPQFININAFCQNLYLSVFYFLGFCNYTSVFLIFSIFNLYDHSVSKNKSKQVLVFILFLVFNCFFCFMIFFLFNRENRVQSILVLAIIGTFLHFFKIAGVIFNLVYYYLKEKKKCTRFKNELIKEIFITQFGTEEQKNLQFSGKNGLQRENLTDEADDKAKSSNDERQNSHKDFDEDIVLKKNSVSDRKNDSKSNINEIVLEIENDKDK
jgi:hypothetical protein